MGRKLDALFGRTFKASKFKTLLGLAISRLAVLKNQRQVRCSHARSDVAQLLQLGHQERALLRVEHVIKEQNTFDAFVMMEGYCNLLIERVALIENQRDCPVELREAIAGLIFASSRCGEFPELQQVREIFTARFGKEFTASAVELRNHCAVNPKIIQKMSTRQPDLEIRIKVTKEIASEKGITLDIEEPSSWVPQLQEDLNMSHKMEDKAEPNINISDHDIEIGPSDELSGSMKAGKKYADVASAAQAAFESAAQAAAAARAAVELSKSESHDKGSDDQSRPDSRGRNRSGENQEDETSRKRAGSGIPTTENIEEHFSGVSEFEKVHPTQHSSSESEDENILSEKFGEKPIEKLERTVSATSLDSIGPINEAVGMMAPSKKVIHFDESDEETEGKDWARIPFKPRELHTNGEPTLLKEVNRSPPSNELRNAGRADYAVSRGQESYENEGIKPQHSKPKQNMPRTGTDSINMQLDEDFSAEKHVQRSEMEKKPASVRTRRGFKW